MTLAHRLTGYDKVKDCLVFTHEIPRPKLPHAIDLAEVPRSDRDAIGVYPLKREQALKMAKLIGKDINTERHDWFFEPASVPVEVSA